VSPKFQKHSALKFVGRTIQSQSIGIGNNPAKRRVTTLDRNELSDVRSVSGIILDEHGFNTRDLWIIIQYQNEFEIWIKHTK